MKKNQQKGTSKIALIIIVVVVLVVLGYALYSSRMESYVPSTLQQTQATIQNDSDLQTVSEDLDSTNVDSIDNELTQNDADAATF